MNSFVAFLLLSNSLFVVSQQFYKPVYEYYWRNFLGDIPIDAVQGGTDKAGQWTYIAQVFVDEIGLIPTRKYIGVNPVPALYNLTSSVERDVHIKLLCSNKPRRLIWTKASAGSLHTSTIGTHLVTGGIENGRLLNIGRIQYQGELIVGKVIGADLENAKLYFPYKDVTIISNDYEVLVYKY